MPVEPRAASREDLGSLQNCLVGGDAEQNQRERRVRRWALAISVTLESAVLAALLLIPLFGRPMGIALTSIPLPPHYQRSLSRPEPTPTTPVETRRGAVCVTCFSRPIAPLRDLRTSNELIESAVPPGLTGPGISLPCPGCTDMLGQGVRPTPPPVETPNKTRIHTQLDPAMLIHRVEPVYPVLPKQMGLCGRVELRAIIATDGTIQSLQVVSGDALFYPSALDAVRQWRYRPLKLNGQPVEVDTYITVIYHLAR